MKITHLIVPGFALGLAALLVAPGMDSLGWTKIGGSLSLTQRDVRLRNNFADSFSNDNVAVESNFPGYDGAEEAIWKSVVEWGNLHGTGAGDTGPTNTLGSGGANFDPTWQGNATTSGGTNDNVNDVLASCGGGGTLAFTETPISDGWRIRFCDEFVWEDGPGLISGGRFDIQGVSTHEYGHALGLGHTTVGGSTMFASVSSSGSDDTRSIESDDIGGVQCVYGVKAGTKPSITAVSVDSGTGVATITGTNFSATGNEVWFTNAVATVPSTDPRVLLTGVSSAGGVITVTPPAGAGDGDVLVKISGTGNDKLSNPYQIDVGTTGGGAPVAQFVGSPTSGLIPLLVAFTDQSTNGPTSWSWTFGDGGTATTQSPSHTYTVAGTYTVTLVATNGAGSDSETKTNYITANGNNTPASCTNDAGDGTNLDIFDCVTNPIIGTNWQSMAVGGAFGASGLAILIGTFGELNPDIPTAFGDLQINLAAPQAALNFGFILGGTASFSVPVPNDTNLVGLMTFNQVYVDQVTVGTVRLTNEIRLVLGV